MNKRINVTRTALPPFEEYVEEISRLWESAWITNQGEKLIELESRLKSFLDVPQLSLFVNGHMALEMVLQALDLSGEVITTPYTFASTTHAIVRSGLEPVFCDIDPVTYTIDADKIESLITEKTCAIVPVHVYGNICDVDKIQQIAGKYGLKVVYDAAHAFGVSFRGRGIGSYGDASIFSFHATKVFHTIEGGAVTFSEDALADKLYTLKNFGIKSEVDVTGVGGNAKMNEFQAAMGLCNLRHNEERLEKRRNLVERYHMHLGGHEGIKLLKEQDGVEPNYAYYPVVFDPEILGIGRDGVAEELNRNGIYPRKYFYPLTNTFTCFADKYDADKTPVAKETAERVLTLPLFPELGLDEVDEICGIILKATGC